MRTRFPHPYVYLRKNKRQLVESSQKISVSMLDVLTQKDPEIKLTLCSDYIGFYRSPIYCLLSLDLLTVVNSQEATCSNNNTTVRISKSPCTYGGHRRWLHCPECDERVTSVFISAHKVACRKCLNLAYTSQSMNTYDRKIAKYKQLKNKVDRYNNQGITAKSRGIQDRTLIQLESKLISIRAEIDRQYLAMTSSFINESDVAH